MINPSESEDVVIHSVQNPKIKHVIKLRDRRVRDRFKQTVIEGFRELRQALANQHYPDQLFFCDSLFLGKNEPQLIDSFKRNNVVVRETSAEVFRKISYRDRPDGLIGISKPVGLTLEDFNLSSENPLLLVTESIEKPGNLGSMLRSADGANVNGVLVCDKTTDINNPNVIRSSLGTIFSVDIVESSSTSVINYLQDRKIKIVSATPDAEKLYWEVDYRCPTAVVVGSEQYGLSESWLKGSDDRVRIPMQGTADSLNVAAAATIILYEAVRQRYPT